MTRIKSELFVTPGEEDFVADIRHYSLLPGVGWVFEGADMGVGTTDTDTEVQATLDSLFPDMITPI